MPSYGDAKQEAVKLEYTCKHAGNAVRVPRRSLQVAVIRVLAPPIPGRSYAWPALHLTMLLHAILIVRARVQLFVPKIAQSRAARLFQLALSPCCSPALWRADVMSI